MQVIKNTPDEYGGYPPLQEWKKAGLPDGYYQWPDYLNTDAFYVYNGFVTLEVDHRGMVTNYAPNIEAWEAWKSQQAETPEPEPTDTEVLNTLLGVSE